ECFTSSALLPVSSAPRCSWPGSDDREGSERAFVKESDGEPASLLHDFVAQQHANIFTRAFSFPANHLPIVAEKEVELADGVVILDDIGLIIQLREREQKVASKAGDLEKWVSNQVVKKGTKQIQ